MNVTLFGIANCDTIRKAKKWLTAHDITFEFHDYRKQGITAALISDFCHQLNWQTVMNKRGTTYRQLSDAQKSSINAANISDWLIAQPAMIKRPILAIDGQYTIGFKAEQYQALFDR